MKATSEYFSSKKEEANKEFKYFKGVDENCNAFNNKNMFDLEQANSFSGFKGEDSLTNFSNAGGCNYSFSAMKGSMNMRNAAGDPKVKQKPFSVGVVYKQTGGGCQDGTQCAVGETCRNGECVPFRDERRMSMRNAAGDPKVKQKPFSVGVVYKQTGGGCQDGTQCAVGETCRNGECVPFRDERKGGASTRANRRMSSNPTSKSTSRRRSSDRIAVKPVMGQGRKSNFAAAARVFPEGQGNYFNGAASSKCGLDR